MVFLCFCVFLQLSVFSPLLSGDMNDGPSKNGFSLHWTLNTRFQKVRTRSDKESDVIFFWKLVAGYSQKGF
jgi:hypothetical protein